MGRRRPRPADRRNPKRNPTANPAPDRRKKEPRFVLFLGDVLLYTQLVLAGCGGSNEFSAEDPQAIRSLLEEQRLAWNQGDLDGFMAAYEPTKELVFTSGGRIRRGWQTTREHYRKRYGQDPSTMGKLDVEILEIQSLGADGAIVLGRWHLSATPEAGSGVFSLGLRRGPLGWRILHDHTSAAPPDPAKNPLEHPLENP
ncbi:MAG TPA: DUF4440 domain-containing protein [Nannocystis exedens]|nr:DUF4440 domain-containing protein [Nannocystis exedens]